MTPQPTTPPAAPPPLTADQLARLTAWAKAVYERQQREANHAPAR